MNKNFDLYNGILIPCIGYGTWQSPNDQTTVDAVLKALNNGYRHIDTASIYGNEESVGKAIKFSNIPREELFITSKVWNDSRGYDKTITSFEESLKKLDLDYLDLYLIHWPANKKQFSNWKEINLDTWRALEKLFFDGKVKAIGVSNFKQNHLEIIMENAEKKPMVNQLEIHPGFSQSELRKYCEYNNILVEAYSPLGRGEILNDDTMKKLSAKYNKSVAQLCIRWCLQNNTVPLPKSVTESRIKENINVFDFEIDDNDMQLIDGISLPEGLGVDPDDVKF